MEKKSLNNYIELAKICKATYSAPIDHRRYTYNFSRFNGQKIVYGSLGRGYCRLLWNNDVIIIAFRGTRENVDWRIANLKFFPVQLTDCGEKAKGIKVHMGFQNALNFVDKTTRIRNFEAVCNHLIDLELLNGRKIIITGHSLGGAVAILYAIKFYNRMPGYSEKNLEQIVTFGSPSVGLGKFKLFYKELNNRTIRIINQSDAVPFTPPLFYSHVGKEVWLNKEGIKFSPGWKVRLLYAFRVSLSNLNKDHAINEYNKFKMKNWKLLLTNTVIPNVIHPVPRVPINKKKVFY